MSDFSISSAVSKLADGATANSTEVRNVKVNEKNSVFEGKKVPDENKAEDGGIITKGLSTDKNNEKDEAPLFTPKDIIAFGACSILGIFSLPAYIYYLKNSRNA